MPQGVRVQVHPRPLANGREWMRMVQCLCMNKEQGQKIDLSNILDASHDNKWVAIAPDYSKVIATAKTLRDLVRSVKDGDAIFHRVLPHDVSFAPAVF